MAQEQLDFEGTRWLKELRAALGDELVDVRCVREGEGYEGYSCAFHPIS